MHEHEQKSNKTRSACALFAVHFANQIIPQPARKVPALT